MILEITYGLLRLLEHFFDMPIFIEKCQLCFLFDKLLFYSASPFLVQRLLNTTLRMDSRQVVQLLG